MAEGASDDQSSVTRLDSTTIVASFVKGRRWNGSRLNVLMGTNPDERGLGMGAAAGSASTSGSGSGAGMGVVGALTGLATRTGERAGEASRLKDAESPDSLSTAAETGEGEIDCPST